MKLYPYASTHPLIEVDDDRLLKRLNPAGSGFGPGAGSPAGARLAGIEDPTREPAAYRALLGPLGIGPCCVDSGPDWVLLERLAAVELWQIGDLAVWEAVCARLAHLHAELAGAGPAVVPVVVHDAALFAAWRDRAARAGVAAPVIEAHARATDRLLALPPTVIHGDLYPSNVLVDPGPPLSVWPVDWELIGMGPAALDLAAITSGAWTDDQRAALVDAYLDSSPPAARADVRAGLAAARLHLCIQWLGSPAAWTPPPEHAHDWRSEAVELAEQV